MSIHKKVLIIALAVFFMSPLVAPQFTHAESMTLPLSQSSLTTQQVQAIISLLQSFGADLTVIANVQASLTGTTPVVNSSSCVDLNNSLYAGITDSQTNGEVSKLQQFLGGSVTGYFGPQTLELVQNWQASHGVVSSGTPDTTGYGFVGPQTRAAMGCSSTVTPPSTAPHISSMTPASGTKGTQITIYGSNLGDATEIDFYHSDGRLGVTVASSVPSVSVSASRITVTVSGGMAGLAGPDTYQVRVVTPEGTSNAVTFVLTDSNVSAPFSVSPSVGSLPLSVTFTYTMNKSASCGGGTYGIYFGDEGAGKDPTHLQYPADACNAYIQHTDHTYAHEGTYTAQLYDLTGNSKTLLGSVNVSVAAVAPVINSFSASPSTIVAGSSTGLSWNASNLGGSGTCAIGSGSTTAMNSVAPGGGASGFVSLSPKTSTTYTLTCTSSNGVSVSRSLTVVVTGSDTTSLSATPTSGAAPLSVNFTGVAGVGAFSISYGDGSWGPTRVCDPGPGSTTCGSIGMSASHTYTTPGTYTSTLSSGGQTSSVIIKVTDGTKAPLSVSCSVSPSNGTTSSPFTWAAQAAGGSGGYTYTWSGTGLWGKSGSSQTFSYGTPPGAGTYAGSVTAADSSGASVAANCSNGAVVQ